MKPVFRCLITVLLSIATMTKVSAQQTGKYMRIASIVVDSLQLAAYKAALQEGIGAAIRLEPGVLMLYAMQETDHPNHITVFEIYASKEAYQSHIETPHFKKYKNTTQPMVQSLVLKDVDPIAIGSKLGESAAVNRE